MDRFVTVYTQPVGALRDVEKCKTEVLYRSNNPAFVTKVRNLAIYLFDAFKDRFTGIFCKNEFYLSGES